VRAAGRLWNCHFTVNQPMVKAVEALEGRFKRVLLSNTHDLHVRFLRERLPLLARFDGLVLSCEVGHVKPEPEIYRRALEVAQCAPREAAFFDDVSAYVEGARAVGIRARVFTTVERFEADLEELATS
jgi:HAD superfamily hydrolase (TIGR01509 family)